MSNNGAVTSMGQQVKGILAQLKETVMPTAEPFDVMVGHLKLPFRGVRDYDEFQDLWDRAGQFEKEVASGRCPPALKEFKGSRPGVLSQAQFFALISLHPELQEPLPWLEIKRDNGLLFKHVIDEVDTHLSLRVRMAEAEGIEQKKDSSRKTRRSAPDSS